MTVAPVIPDLHALVRVRPSRFARRLARGMWWCLLALPPALTFVPWQQQISGSGRVVSYDPLHRQQSIEAPISGRIVEWYAGTDGDPVKEGEHVAAGEPLLRIEDIDPRYHERLEAQVVASEANRQAALDKLAAYERAVQLVTQAREFAIAAVQEKQKAAEQKVAAEKRGADAATAAESQARANFERQKQLYSDKLTSKLDLEVQERKYLEEAAKLDQAKNYWQAAQSEAAAVAAEIEKVSREADAKIQSAKADRDAANGELQTKQKELVSAQTTLARYEQNKIVRAPRDGVVLRLMAVQGSDQVKEGDPLAIIVPKTLDHAVELWLDGNDVPLVQTGRHVRLQFEGWPAVQFTGWPSIAYGTFGGKVALVDATDNGKGKFRVLVVQESPEEQAKLKDKPWPSDRFLRQGVRANGWVMLENVRLGFELWRQLNGFPPVVDTDEPVDPGYDKKSK